MVDGDVDVGEINRRFGDAVRVARMNAKLTQRELATAIDLKRTSISNIEMGVQTVTVPTLIRMCYALGVSVTQLIDSNVAQPATQYRLAGKYARSAKQILERDVHAD